MRLLAISIALLGAAAASGATETVPRLQGKVFHYPPHVDTLQGSFIVEFEDHNVGAHAKRLDALSGFAVRKRFDSIFHGAVVAASQDLDPETLAGVHGVKRVWRNRKHRYQVKEASATSTPSPTFLHEMTGVERVLKEMGLDGKGVKIGIVDSGVDYTHPDLGNCWKTKGCPWQYGQDFVGDEYNIDDDNPIIKPLDTPLDCGGHGTHVSGIIAAKGTQVQGVAPGATFGMYRALGCPKDGELATDDSFILQAMEAAFKDGHDIINLSIGSVGWPEDPVAVLASKLVERGVVVVAAAGNEGEDGMLTANSPAVGHGAISVGSVDNWNYTAPAISVTTTADKRSIRISAPSTNRVPFVFDKETPLATPKDKDGGIFGCNDSDADLKGAIAVVYRGNCTFTEKAQIVVAKGAIGLVVINDKPGLFALDIARDIKIPAVLIGKDDGEYIVAGVAKGKSTLVANADSVATFANTETGGQMSTFSSYGPDPELGLVPLISAPGGNIRSAYPVKLGSYKSLSGTSMATPYISGVVALLKQAKPDLTVAQIRGILTSTATPLKDSITAQAVSPFHSGAGLVNVYSAVKSRALITPAMLGTNITARSQSKDYAQAPKNGVRLSVHTLTFNNTDTSKRATVELSFIPATALTMYESDGNYAKSLVDDRRPLAWPANPKDVPPTSLPQVKYSTNKLTVDAGATTKFNVTIAAPYGLDEAQRWFYGGYITMAATWDGDKQATTYTVPFGGFNGDYSKIEMLSPKSAGFPTFADHNFKPINSIAGFEIDPKEPPLFVFSLDISAPLLWTALIDAKNNTAGYLAGGYTDYVPRTMPSIKPVFMVVVNNTIFKEPNAEKLVIAPAGKYSLRLAVLRPFGDRSKSDDFEIWDSDVFSFK